MEHKTIITAKGIISRRRHLIMRDASSAWVVTLSGQFIAESDTLADAERLIDERCNIIDARLREMDEQRARDMHALELLTGDE